MTTLAQLDVLVVDCQATAAGPRGHLLELGWARTGTTATRARARLIRLPPDERIPPAVIRITGISEHMLGDGVDSSTAWAELLDDAAALAQQPAPTVVHFARFERPFLEALAGGAPPLEVVCTHRIARRVLPDLPRCSLRALAGYFGRAVGALRRSSDHVEATAFVWRHLVALLVADGVATWNDLRRWLAASPPSTRARRAWPMPRDVRLSLPDAPGLYRMLRTSGDVLYVGKATSLRHRVNSYFRKQHGVHERTLEMLSQARGVSFDVTPSPLEAALLEPDEIKRHRPPYNVALTLDDRAVWFAARDLLVRDTRPSARCPVGPFASAETLDRFAALVRGSAAALGRDRWAPAAATFEAGYARFCSCHPEFGRRDLCARSQLLRVAVRLWREGRRDRDGDSDEAGERERGLPVWTPESVQLSLEWLTLRMVLALRRAHWLTRLVDASLVWTEPGVDGVRLIVIERGDLVASARVEHGAMPVVPPGRLRVVRERHEAFTLERLDRLRVLGTEIKRLVAQGAPVAVRFGEAPPLAGPRLARIVSRV